MKTLLMVTVMLGFCIVPCCRKESVAPLPPPTVNLISNSGFEINGQQSFQGWTGAGNSFSNDVPTGGGSWSLQLAPQWYPEEGYAETFITGLSGSQIINFSCYAKVMNNWTGRILVQLETQSGNTTTLYDQSLNIPVWTALSAIINQNLQPSDKIIVHLSAGSTEVAVGDVLFDNVVLEIYNHNTD